MSVWLESADHSIHHNHVWEADDNIQAGTCVMIDGQSTMTHVKRTLAVWNSGGVATWSHPKWPASMTAVAAAVAGVGQRHPLRGPAALVFTSGSSGAPKAVLLPMAVLETAADAGNRRVPFGAGDRWLLSLPLCHVGGLSIVMRAWRGGGTAVIADERMSLAEALLQHKPSHLSLVATQLMRLLGDPTSLRALQGCREVMVGGGPVSPALLSLASDRGVLVRQTWGMTETAAQICTSLPGQNHCGWPIDGMELRSKDGVLEVRGSSLFEGYVDTRVSLQPERPCDVDGWFSTGDVGIIGDSGVTITGRVGRRFISGGENIHPEAVALLLSDANTQVWVVPVADPLWGMRPFAFFVSESSDHSEVIQRLQERAIVQLPSYMRPVGVAPLPATMAMKPSLSALTECAKSIMDTEKR
jgi:o-succinylbenzoate---CoA ligase